MKTIELQLEPNLIEGKALQIAMRGLIDELAAFEYDRKTGLAKITTRAFPAFDETRLVESELSKELETTAQNLNNAQRGLERDARELTKREANAIRREAALDQRKKDLDKEANLIQRQRKQLEKDIAKAARAGLGTRIKSFFQNIK